MCTVQRMQWHPCQQQPGHIRPPPLTPSAVFKRQPREDKHHEQPPNPLGTPHLPGNVLATQPA
jgi:hypothetical protein